MNIRGWPDSGLQRGGGTRRCEDVVLYLHTGGTEAFRKGLWIKGWRADCARALRKTSLEATRYMEMVKYDYPSICETEGHG
jgi:hypothetical protein